MFAAFLCVCAAGAAATAQTLTVTYPAASTVTPPLSQLPDGPKPIGNTEHAHRPVPSHAGQGGGLDTAVQTFAGPLISAAGGTSFDGPGANGYAPPDNNIAVGPNHIFAAVNSMYQIFTKSGASVLGPKTLSSLWTGVGGGCATANAGDVVVQYDKGADRWILTQLSSLSSPYGECIAVSTTGDPTGSYKAYYYSFGSNLPDYPKFGVWPTATNSAYLATYNLFANAASFAGAALCAYDRTAMLAGAASPAQICGTINDASYLPSDLDGSTAPANGTPGYFVTYETLSSLRIWRLAPNFASPGSSTLTQASPDLAVTPFSELCSGGTCVPQTGTNNQLDSLGDRPMYRLAYRNFGDHQAMVFDHSVSAGLRWYELRAATGAGSPFNVFQQGTYAPDSTIRWMGSAAMDQSGDLAIGYSASSSSIHPAVRYTGRVPGDPLGSLESELSIIEGTGSQTNNLHRWGDYSSLRIDPSDDCTFWYVNEYLKSDGAFNWSTRVGSFKFTGCGAAVTATTTGLSASPASPSTFGASVTFTATVTPSGGSGTPTGTVTFKDGSATLGTPTLSGGIATFTTSLSGGSHSITAAYGGDSSFSGSTSSTLPYTVNAAGTTTGLSANPTSLLYGQSTTLTATVTSGATGTVTFFDGGASLGTSSLSGGQATLSISTLPVGTRSITARYNGSANYAPSTSSAVQVTVSQATTTTALSSSSPTSTVGQSVTFTATVTPATSGTPTGSVTFFDGAATLGSGILNSSRQATFSTSSLSAGTHSITAAYGGDTNFMGSTSAVFTQTVNAANADFSISASPGNDVVKQPAPAKYTVTITPSNGFSGVVTFGIASGPPGTFSAGTITGSGTTTLTVPTGTLAKGNYTITITGTSGGLIHSTSVSLRVR